jgi:hypothetical protein
MSLILSGAIPFDFGIAVILVLPDALNFPNGATTNCAFLDARRFHLTPTESNRLEW